MLETSVLLLDVDDKTGDARRRGLADDLLRLVRLPLAARTQVKDVAEEETFSELEARYVRLFVDPLEDLAIPSRYRLESRHLGLAVSLP